MRNTRFLGLLFIFSLFLFDATQVIAQDSESTAIPEDEPRRTGPLAGLRELFRELRPRLGGGRRLLVLGATTIIVAAALYFFSGETIRLLDQQSYAFHGKSIVDFEKV